MAKQNKKIFDIIVIGNNWTGLSLASSLSKNKSVALINSFKNQGAYQASEEFSGEFEYLPKKDSSFCLLYTSPSPRDRQKSRMPSSA